MGIVENITDIAKEKKIHICEIERSAGLSRSSIYKWRDHAPNVDSLKKVADILGVTVDRLLR